MLDPKDCIHLIGFIPHFRDGHVVFLDKDDIDLLDEPNAVAFNYCGWCGVRLVKGEIPDGIPETTDRRPEISDSADCREAREYERGEPDLN